jgi:hypothetical protein
MCGYNDCPCPRYIPQEKPPPGPRLCRDCEHWESLHPTQATTVKDFFSRVAPEVQKIRKTAETEVSDDEARQEATTGFRKASDKSTGRGGSTKFKVLVVFWCITALLLNCFIEKTCGWCCQCRGSRPG